jgi:cobalt/nickel transport system permease protein
VAHIPDGVLSPPVLIGGWAVAAIGVGLALRRLDESRIARTAILSAAFFTVSLLMIPLGPTSVHLLLSALMGLSIGIAAIPAVMVALALQMLLFGVGGLTTLGINTVNIALPGVLIGLLAGPWISRLSVPQAMLAGGLAAAGAVALTAGGVVLALLLSHSAYSVSAQVLGITYVPLLLAEALVTAFAVGFLKRVKPEVFPAGLPRPLAAE